MSVETTRRSVLMGALGLAGAMTFFGAAYAETTRLRLAWWGGNERTRRTQEVLKLYQQHVTGVELAGEVSNSEYFTKLATQVVGRSAPDVFQLEPNSFADFVKRDCVLALDGLMPNPIDAAGISRAMLDLCAVDGKVWGIPQALNSFAMMYDKDAFATAGVAPPDAQTSWDDYADRMVELTKALNRRRYWGSCDASGYSYAFQVWLRQRGRDLFTADQALGFGKDDVAEWFSYWDKLRQRGGCVPADVAALSPDFDDQPHAADPGQRGDELRLFQPDRRHAGDNAGTAGNDHVSEWRRRGKTRAVLSAGEQLVDLRAVPKSRGGRALRQFLR